MLTHKAIKNKRKTKMPAAILETVEATWDRPRTGDELRNFLGPRFAGHELNEVVVESDALDVEALLDNVE
jgi:hypothetical protein